MLQRLASRQEGIPCSGARPAMRWIVPFATMSVNRGEGLVCRVCATMIR
jgi:hypothetical protein